MKMVTFSEQRKQNLLSNFKNKKILVIGDLMLDRYLWGNVIRISPEAPVPVVEVESEATRLGGAANVANNIATLTAIPIPIGVIGNDEAGRVLKNHFQESGFSIEGIMQDPLRRTTTKTRIIAHNQHVVRADQESKQPISQAIADKLLKKLQPMIEACDAIIFEDYNKGLLTSYLIRNIIQLAGSKNKIITVDPKFDNFFEYQNITLMKPNRKETEGILGRKLTTEQNLLQASQEIKTKLACQNVLITLGEHGMCLLESNDEFSFIPTKAQKVHDVSGAGDTVISTLTVALVAGATMKEATTLANYAAGVVCSEVGVVPIQLEKLAEAIE
jgi:D-glycero-beta-D-manno-heptose-7-phosphate kinase